MHLYRYTLLVSLLSDFSDESSRVVSLYLVGAEYTEKAQRHHK